MFEFRDWEGRGASGGLDDLMLLQQPDLSSY